MSTKEQRHEEREKRRARKREREKAREKEVENDDLKKPKGECDVVVEHSHIQSHNQPISQQDSVVPASITVAPIEKQICVVGGSRDTIKDDVASLICSLNGKNKRIDDATIILQTIEMTSSLVFTDEVDQTNEFEFETHNLAVPRARIAKKSPLSFDQYCNTYVVSHDLVWFGKRPYFEQWLAWLVDEDEVDPERSFLKLFLTYFPTLRRKLTIKKLNE